MSARVAASAVAVKATVCRSPNHFGRLHRAERRIFGTEVVAPLRNAMRLVDRKHRDLGALEQIERLGLEQAFRRDIEEPQLAAREVFEHRAIFECIIG